MAKRFTSTEIWGEDWFLDMPNDYKLYWYYVLSSCDHCGLFKVNSGSFCRLLGVKIDSKEALRFFNNGKDRILEVSSSIWLINDFFVYQYGDKFNINNRVHASIEKAYKRYNIELTSIRGLKEYTYTLKDKDKDKDIDNTEEVKNNIESRKKIFYDSISKFKDSYPKEVLREFYEYWIEPNKSNTKMRFELERTWDLSLRLKKWANNNFSKIIKPKDEKIKINL